MGSTDVEIVHVGQRAHEFLHDLVHHFFVQCFAICGQFFEQLSSVQVLHHNEDVVGVDVVLVDLHNVRVVQLGQELDLLAYLGHRGL